jgi:UDP-2-acetamido-3-amino-2,3-dideoxy-glucuronate N-acetyltransferase
VPDHALVVGVPGKQVGWMSRFGERLRLPLVGEGNVRCPHTGDEYALRGGLLALKTPA